MELDPNKHRLSEEDHQSILENKIIPRLFSGKKSTDNPVAVIFGGQPGAGKSAAVEDAIHELYDRGGAVDIIGDDLRGDHPLYDSLLSQDDKTAAFYTDRDTGLWIEKTIAYAKEKKINIVIEGTMRDGNKVAKTMESLRTAGYEIDARVLAVSEMLSHLGILHRYERQKADRGEARMTTPQSHKAAYDGIPLTLERIERDKLADRVTLYRRGAEVIYSNRLQDGEWLKEPQARVALEAERSRPMNRAEIQAYVKILDDLADLLTKSERQATPDEIKALESLRQFTKGPARWQGPRQP
jgi:predicted ABC-type ATPase